MRRPKFESKSGVYLIVNTANGNFYVGSSRDLPKRFSAHRRALETGRHEGPGLQAAWDKYGAEAFRFEVLEYCEPNRLIEVEQGHIDGLRPRYNRNPIAGKPPATVYTDERRARVSAQFKGRRHTEETKRRMSEAAKGRVFSDDHRQKLIAANRKKAEARRGTKDSEETRRKKSEARQRFAALNPGLPHLDQARRNRAKIKPDQIAEVWVYKDQGLTYEQIAKIYNVRYWVIGDIIRKGRPADCPTIPKIE